MWAKENNAEYYSHYFTPLNSNFAEKRVVFSHKINIFNANEVKNLLSCEVDASSFPNGDARKVDKAKGCVRWDNSINFYIFKQGDCKILYIPSVLVSNAGECLDSKLPLIRATKFLSQQAVKVLNLLGNKKVKNVNLEVGVEQEYFLLNNKVVTSRKDIMLANRSMFGKNNITPITTHYCSQITNQENKFLNLLNCELWKLGIPIQVFHKEVAPCQFEAVTNHTTAIDACEQNQFLVKTIENCAENFNFKPIFHEKPFSCLSGSGKHLNFSLTTNTGYNLVSENGSIINLIFLSAVINAFCEYSNLLIASISNYANDLRLGGKEAPNNILSVSIDNSICEMLKEAKIEKVGKTNKNYERNRTCAVGYDGIKFEYRMVGASNNLYFVCACIATAIGNSLKNISNQLSKNNSIENIKTIIKNLYNKNKKIIYNKNCYSAEWINESKNRGLQNYKNALETCQVFDNENIIKLFNENKILNKNEIQIIKTELQKNYVNNVQLDAEVLVSMLKENCLLINNYISQNSINLQKEFKNLNNLINNLEINLSKYKIQNYDSKIQECDILLNLIKKVSTAYTELENKIPQNVLNYSTTDKIIFNI